MTRTRKSILLTALLVVSAMAAGVSVADVPSDESPVRQQTEELEAVPLDSGGVYWQSQFLRFNATQNNASEVWEVRRVEDDDQLGGLVTEILLDGSGTATFGTANLDGEYVIVDENDRPVVFEDGNVTGVGSVSEASFEVNRQTLNATFADETVLNDDSQDARTDLRVGSNRAGYGFYLQSEQLNASQLADVFSSVEVRNDRAVSTRPVSSDAVFDANFTGVEPGTYNVTVLASDGTAEDTASITVTEPVEGSASLATTSVTEQRGDVARFGVTFDGTDRATVTVGSQQVGFLARFTVVDEDGDGEATVAVNTYEAGISPETPGISAVGEDRVTDYRLRTDPIPGRLDAATYPIEVVVGTTRTAVGSLVLNERSTGGMTVWTAPESANFANASQVAEVATQNQTVAFQDWAIVQVESSGLYGYVQNMSDLTNDTTGVSMSLTRVGEINVPSTTIPLQQGRLLVDEENNQFFVLMNSNVLEEGGTYRANFTVSGENPYVSAANATTLTRNFTVVERNVTFEGPVQVPASGSATISGTATVAPGTELTVEAANTGQTPFLKRQTATVSEDGTWEVTFDFSDVEPGTNFSVSVNEPSANATGVVGGEEAPAEQTTTPAEETTTPTEETTVADEADGETTEAEETGADAETTEAEEPDVGAETTTAAEADEGEETTVESAAAPAPGFGAVSLLAGLIVLVAGAAIASRRP